MRSAREHSDSYHFNRNTALWLWLAFIVLLLSAASVRGWQNHQRRAIRQQWEKQRQQNDLLQQKARERVRALWRAQPWSDALSRSELEKELNDSKPFILRRNGEKSTATWTDVRSGQRFDFIFSDGKWSGWRTMRSAPNPPAPTPSAFDQATEAIRRQVAGWNRGWGPFLWLVLLVLCLALKRYRMLLGQLLLAAALVSFTAWLVSPHYSLALSNIFSNDMLFWGVVMLVVSVTVIVWFVVEDRRRRRAGLLCPNCQYNLKANVTGKCPECGCPIPQNLQWRIQADMGLTRS